ncbi:copper resistance CopC/CopD family protein [Paenibacillus sp. MBLB4367]|uniref:copper resistance CopC/CopD family protein n=1 Tax=Paenibacillus sp. MBLB4367 TaxID=3384767 RepID=UPI0039082FC2
MLNLWMPAKRTTIWKPLLPLLLLLAALLAVPSTAFGHASLVQAVPEPNSQMDTPPRQISLTFNERIEEKLFYMKVLDEIGRPATSEKAKLNPDNTGLTLDLPELPKGAYLVTYHVISADGHPVDGSYVITVGPPRNTTASIGNEHQHSLSWNMGFQDLLKYASRIASYLTLLTLAGWIVWSALLSGQTGETRNRLNLWAVGLQRAYVISLLVLIYSHYDELLGEGGISELFGLFTGTSIGLSWMASLLLALAGFVLLRRHRILDMIWVAALLAAKSVNGHAMAFDPRLATVPLDWIHLAGAALWVGGIVMVAVFWRNSDVRERLLPRFSRMAFLSIIVLTLTGAASTLLFLPKLDYLLYTQWGTLLLIKVGLVLLVLISAGTIRLMLRKRQNTGARLWLRIDLTLMVLIVIVVGVLTYVAPVPPNQPFAYHEMGTKVHMTTRITPNVPGTNTFIVKAWLPDKLGKPKYVQLNMIYNDDKSIAPIEVPIEPYDDKELDAFLDFTRYSFKATGPYMPFAGSWTVEIRVMDSNDDETVYKQQMRIY